jgi:flagellar hook-associated protein 1 FlgK
MGSISSLSRAVSALMTSQSALNTTAHNITNVDTKGYTRQQVIMSDSRYSTVGASRNSGMQIGLGTDVQVIRQVRDRFLDSAFREENSRLGFYQSKSNAIEEVENILGEIEGESFSKILNNLWESMSELAKSPEGLETRGTFIQNATIFVEKSNLIMGQLQDYQKNLNTKVMNNVKRINEIGQEIRNLNEVIAEKEVHGAKANDYRDQRNLLVDELSEMVDVSYREDIHNNMIVSIENVPFVTVGHVNTLDLTYAENKSLLVDPYWPHLSDLVSDPPQYQKLYNIDIPTTTAANNDKGSLKGLILTRGTRTANYTDLDDPTTYKKYIEPSEIMTVQAQFDNLIHGVVTMINDTLAPVGGTTGPYGLNGEQGHEIFSRQYIDDRNVTEDDTNEYTLYSAGNLKMNEEVVLDYNKIGLSREIGVDGDSSVVEEMLEKWQTPFSNIDPSLNGELNFVDYYNSFVSGVGTMGSGTNNQVANQQLLTGQIDNQRNQMTGVSSDEELSNMMKYQHAYNAASRVVSVVDDMIERVVNQTGLVGR